RAGQDRFRAGGCARARSRARRAEAEEEQEGMKTLTGFHAVTSRLRQRPETIREIYVDAARSDARAKELKRAASAANVRVIPVDAKRPRGIAVGRRAHR